jgi:hypothetical protein
VSSVELSAISGAGAVNQGAAGKHDKKTACFSPAGEEDLPQRRKVAGASRDRPSKERPWPGEALAKAARSESFSPAVFRTRSAPQILHQSPPGRRPEPVFGIIGTFVSLLPEFAPKTPVAHRG